VVVGFWFGRPEGGVRRIWCSFLCLNDELRASRGYERDNVLVVGFPSNYWVGFEIELRDVVDVGMKIDLACQPYRRASRSIWKII